ncbi:MAG: hypothetical protein HYR91_14905 [Flavobacteriia bacterium]|nr:hypothetical protein [Flavobacteriia bacterium]
MKNIILQIFFITVTTFTYCQTQVLKEFDFNDGGYSILGVKWGGLKNSLLDSIGEFYTKDTSILNQIKTDWFFSIPGQMYACGYHYEIFICKNGLVLKSLRVNLECNEIVTDEAYFYFDSDKLRKFHGKFKIPLKKIETFENLTKARDYRDRILKNENLIMTPSPLWIKYEGEFDFTFKCNEKKKTCYRKEDRLKIMINNEITLNYPNEEFILTDRGGSWTEILQTVYCNKSLSDKFDLYYRDKESYFGKWKPFELSLVSYWCK